MLLTQTTPSDYENLCRLDILGLKDHPTGDQSNVYQEFKEQLVRTPDDWYKTGLLWKGNHPPLANNKEGSIKRLESLVRKLDKQPDMLEKYDSIIKDQLSQGIVERVEEEPKERNFTFRTNQSYVKQQKVLKPELCMMLPLVQMKDHLP
jgi:hypothetical protein